MSPAGRSWKWWVCGALLLATMLNYMDRLTLALTATQLESAIQLDDARYGTLEESFSYAFAAGGILFGFVADRIGPRRLYPVVLVGWSLAGIASPLANWPAIAQLVGEPAVAGQGEFRWLLLCRTVLGLCEAGHWPCALLTARNILSDSERPLGNSILQSGASFGAVATPLVVQALRVAGASWQAPFVSIGIAGLAWIPLWFILMQRGDMQHSPAARATTSREPLSIGRVVLQFTVLTIIVVTISLAWQFHRAWLPKYLEKHHGAYLSEQFGDARAATYYFTSAYYLVAGLGSLVFGAAASAIAGRGVQVKWARLIVFAACALFVAFTAAVPVMASGPMLLIVLMAAGAGSLGAHPIYYSLVQELPPRQMGLFSGILSAASWVAVGRMQGAAGEYIKEMNAVDPARSFDLPLILVGLAPLAGLTALAVWVVFDRSGPRSNRIRLP